MKTENNPIQQNVFFPNVPKLPPEIFSLIVTYLDPIKDFKNVNLTCKKWSHALEEPNLWKFLVQRDLAYTAKKTTNYREEYQKVAFQRMRFQANLNEDAFFITSLNIHESYSYFLEFSDKYFISGAGDQKVKIWDLETTENLITLDIPLSDSSRSYIHEGILYISSTAPIEDCIYCIDLNNFEFLPKIPNAHDFMCNVFKVHDQILIGGGSDADDIGKLVFFDLARQKEPQAILLNQNQSVCSIEIIKHELLVVTSNGNIFKWDLKDLNSEVIPKATLLDSTGYRIKMARLYNDQLFLNACTKEPVIKIWDRDKKLLDYGLSAWEDTWYKDYFDVAYGYIFSCMHDDDPEEDIYICDLESKFESFIYSTAHRNIMTVKFHNDKLYLNTLNGDLKIIHLLK